MTYISDAYFVSLFSISFFNFLKLIVIFFLTVILIKQSPRVVGSSISSTQTAVDQGLTFFFLFRCTVQTIIFLKYFLVELEVSWRNATCVKKLFVCSMLLQLIMNNTCLHRLHRWPPFTNNPIINIGSCRTHAKYIFIYLLKMILKAWSSLYLTTNRCWAFPSQNSLNFSKSRNQNLNLYGNSS